MTLLIALLMMDHMGHTSFGEILAVSLLWLIHVIFTAYTQI